MRPGVRDTPELGLSTRPSTEGAVGAANFCDHVGMVTFLGAYESQEAFIRAKLNPAIKANLLTMANAPTIVKRRFVETYPFQKLFEVYVMDDGERSQPEIASLNDLL